MPIEQDTQSFFKAGDPIPAEFKYSCLNCGEYGVA